MTFKTGLHVFIGALCALLFSACGTFNKTAKSRQQEQPQIAKKIPIHHVSSTTKNNDPDINSSIKSIPAGVSDIEEAKSWQFKYAQLLDLPVEEVVNEKLFGFIDDWYGTPYRFGGNSKQGIDCSNFVNTMMASVFNLSLIGNSVQLYAKSARVQKKNLKPGDLVFFKIHHRRISHVGVYLRNDRFVHASSSSGVMISDLNETYWKRYYAGAGRIKKS
ncbi:glycoside hydrolase [Chitinophaga caeni]|uniref:Glycoside hydrolase n=1 Tax=Chitinophaga caeni TaxID=2029983 RepID=A0A291QYC2_9BACT|nr:NlpC/P60 family protein [Chitinophaga caeni]ATL49019.1 glycoside hydrolase [Chitinophaga caeni]